MDFPQLPVLEVLPDLLSALEAGDDAALVSPPGSGKTSCAPLALLDGTWRNGKTIILLEPRRVAARAAAWRMSDIAGDEIGGLIGYRLRLESKVSVRTKVLVLTEGLLVRKILEDPELSDVAAVIFDEFHERSLQADLALALCRDIQSGIRPDLRIVFMSATIDAEELAAKHNRHLKIISSEGRQYPVQTKWIPQRDRFTPLPLRTASTCIRALREQSGGVLAFLPGEGEIRSTAKSILESHDLPSDVVLHTLFGAMSKKEQDAALASPPPGKRKLVLATSIAESSLTINAVSAVVDSGMMRVSRFSSATGMQRLETLRETRDRADQRRGRAGRLPPGGVCYRMWDEATDAAMAPAAPPEIISADLADTVLAVADWGVTPDKGITGIPWQTPPPETSWNQAKELLISLGALDSNGRLTSHGREMAKLPMHPRLANMLIRSRSSNEASLVAAILSEPIAVNGATGERVTDLSELLHLIISGSHAVSAYHRDRIISLTKNFSRESANLSRSAETFDPGRVLALAFPDRIGRRRNGDGTQARYLLTCGRGCTLKPNDPLGNHEWIVVAELDDSNADAAVRLAAPLSNEYIEKLGFTTLEDLSWDTRSQCVIAAEREMLGAIVIRERPMKKADPDKLLNCMCAGICSEGISRLNWTPAAIQLRARLALLAKIMPEDGWPDVSDESLKNEIAKWLGPMLEGCKSLAKATEADISTALLNWIGYKKQRELDRLVPVSLPVPSGSTIKIDYSGEKPVLAARIQEVFGMKETPRICGGRLPVVMHLLSPARRPVQITSDLASFWRTGYAEARKDLRPRYPKHYWPEDPTTATPTSRVRPRN